MRLLVSVRDHIEGQAALAGGADIIDAKEPKMGALGAVSLATLRAIVSATAGARPVTAAIGDAADEATVARIADAFVLAGAALVKVGFAGVPDPHRVEILARAAARGAGPGRVVAVAYADYARVDGPRPDHVIHIAQRIGAAGVLLDTAIKIGAGLTRLMQPDGLAAWVHAARDRGLITALAGKLTADDLRVVHEAGADIAGVRGAACDGGRDGCISTDRVRDLCARCEEEVPSPP
jgi:uncharacterized protein (UPF0264 family)